MKKLKKKEEKSVKIAFRAKKKTCEVKIDKTEKDIGMKAYLINKQKKERKKERKKEKVKKIGTKKRNEKILKNTLRKKERNNSSTPAKQKRIKDQY